MIRDNLLVLDGLLRAGALWPGGRSDADTVTIDIDDPDRAFTVKKDGSSRARATRAFSGSKVRGAFGPAEIIRRTRHGWSVTVRLQGIDAPELHYRPLIDLSALPAIKQKRAASAEKKWNHEFRQPHAEAAAAFLGERLRAARLPRDDDGRIRARVVSRVTGPGDAFDCYGRFIGNVLLGEGARPLDLNLWLVENGQALPTFYDCMTRPEITALTRRCTKARARRAGLWTGYRSRLPAFDFDLRYRSVEGGRDELGAPRPAEIIARTDRGALTLPKLFRRNAIHAVSGKLGLTKLPFREWLATRSDEWLPLEDYLAALRTADTAAAIPKSLRALPDALPAFAAGKLRPEDMVFHEASATLMRGGREVGEW